MSSNLSDTWLGISGNIDDPANYEGVTVFPIDEIPEGEGLGSS